MILYSQPEGFYYLQTSYEYRHLTDEELEYIPKILLKKVAGIMHTEPSLLHLEQLSEEYVTQGKNEVHYVKNGKQYRGKLSISYRYIGDYFNVIAVFYMRQGVSKLQRAALKTPKLNHSSEHTYAPEKRDYHKVNRFGKEWPHK